MKNKTRDQTRNTNSEASYDDHFQWYSLSVSTIHGFNCFCFVGDDSTNPTEFLKYYPFKKFVIFRYEDLKAYRNQTLKGFFISDDALMANLLDFIQLKNIKDFEIIFIDAYEGMYVVIPSDSRFREIKRSMLGK